MTKEQETRRRLYNLGDGIAGLTARIHNGTGIATAEFVHGRHSHASAHAKLNIERAKTLVEAAERFLAAVEEFAGTQEAGKETT